MMIVMYASDVVVVAVVPWIYQLMCVRCIIRILCATVHISGHAFERDFCTEYIFQSITHSHTDTHTSLC